MPEFGAVRIRIPRGIRADPRETMKNGRLAQTMSEGLAKKTIQM